MFSSKTRNTIMALVASFSVAGAAIAPAVVPSVSQALPIETNGSGKSKKDLEGEGYTCEVVSEGFQECTKDGSPTYWCSGDTCEVAPTRVRPVGPFRPKVILPAPLPITFRAA